MPHRNPKPLPARPRRSRIPAKRRFRIPAKSRSSKCRQALRRSPLPQRAVGVRPESGRWAPTAAGCSRRYQSPRVRRWPCSSGEPAISVPAAVEQAEAAASTEVLRERRAPTTAAIATVEPAGAVRPTCARAATRWRTACSSPEGPAVEAAARTTRLVGRPAPEAARPADRAVFSRSTFPPARAEKAARRAPVVKADAAGRSLVIAAPRAGIAGTWEPADRAVADAGATAPAEAAVVAVATTAAAAGERAAITRAVRAAPVVVAAARPTSSRARPTSRTLGAALRQRTVRSSYPGERRAGHGALESLRTERLYGGNVSGIVVPVFPRFCFSGPTQRSSFDLSYCALP